VSARAAVARLDAWLFAPQPVQPLVLARIVFGLVIFLDHAFRIGDLQTLYGPEGLMGPLWFPPLKPYLGHFVWDARAAHALEALLPALTPGLVAALYALLLVASLCFAIGLRTRTAGLVALLIFAWLSRARDPFAYWGWARFMQPLMLYVILAPSGRFYSVDAWLRRRRSGEPQPSLEQWRAPAWPLRLLQVHTCSMYAVTGLARLDDLGWLRGHALFNALSNAQFSRFVIDWRPFQPLLAAATWATFALEPLAPLLLWTRRIGPAWAYALIAMHAGLELATNVGWWSFVMGAALLAFLPTSHLDALLRRLPGGPRAAPRDPRVS
jgi:hypothetical protein